MRLNPTHLLSLSILALAGAILFMSVQPAQAAGAMATSCEGIHAVRMTAAIIDNLRGEGRTHFVVVGSQVCAW